ncbi:hypothetical protein K438DRAFT_1777846 [Mycena galopus ATCC 62051]|nr:hypothetical protein K438DRAFT_1777846 [Mycena galopus ATCC 62051]
MIIKVPFPAHRYFELHLQLGVAAAQPKSIVTRPRDYVVPKPSGLFPFLQTRNLSPISHMCTLNYYEIPPEHLILVPRQLGLTADLRHPGSGHNCCTRLILPARALAAIPTGVLEMPNWTKFPQGSHFFLGALFLWVLQHHPLELLEPQSETIAVQSKLSRWPPG